MKSCPCCKRPLKVAGGNPADKKLAQDTARAQGAIDTLRNHIERGGFAGDTGASNRLRVEAAKDEVLRLNLAIVKPERLWRIYRRADKGVSYVQKYQLKKAA